MAEYRQVQLRFNTEKEMDNAVYQIIQNVDVAKYKSQNHFIKMAIIEYYKKINAKSIEQSLLTEDKLYEITRKAVEDAIRMHEVTHRLASNKEETAPDKEKVLTKEQTGLAEEALNFINSLDID